MVSFLCVLLIVSLSVVLLFCLLFAVTLSKVWSWRSVICSVMFGTDLQSILTHTILFQIYLTFDRNECRLLYLSWTAI